MAEAAIGRVGLYARRPPERAKGPGSAAVLSVSAATSATRRAAA
jgi:hypothetical protein